MKLVVIGSGYVGLVSGLCFAELGYEILFVDKDQSRLESIAKGACPFFEPGLDDLLNKHLNSTKRLTFSSDLASAVQQTNVVFITVGNINIERAIPPAKPLYILPNKIFVETIKA